MSLQCNVAPTCPWFCLARPFSPPLRLATLLRPLRLPLLSRESPPTPFNPCCWSRSDKAKSLFCSGRESPGRGLRGAALILDPVVLAHFPPSLSSLRPRSSSWRWCSSVSVLRAAAGVAGRAWRPAQHAKGVGRASAANLKVSSVQLPRLKRPPLRGCCSQTSGIFQGKGPWDLGLRIEYRLGEEPCRRFSTTETFPVCASQLGGMQKKSKNPSWGPQPPKQVMRENFPKPITSGEIFALI